MKKNYFLTMLACLTLSTLSAQYYTDDMESYVDGQPIFEGHWSSWDATEGFAAVSSSTYARSGSLSGYIGPSDASDAILDLGNVIFGSAEIEFWMYIPSNLSAYYNFQGNVPVVPQWLFDVFFNVDGTDAGNGSIQNFEDSDGDGVTDGIVSFTYPEDTWFKVVTKFDVSLGIGSATFQFDVNGVNVMPAGTPLMAFVAGGVVESPSAIGGIDFYSNGATNEYYVDDINYSDVLSVDDLKAKGFSAYPNPVNDVLNLRANEEISSVEIFNVLGQKVYSANVDALTTTVDMSRFNNGAYFVKAVVGNTEGTVKILK